MCGGFNRLLLLCIPLGCGHPLGQKYLFVTLDRERRFMLVVVPSDVATLFWGRVVVFIRPPSDCRVFLWLVAALLPCLSLFFDSGLSSPGLICCSAMSLRFVDLLSYDCAPTVCLATGFVAIFPVLRSPAGSGCAGSCGFSSPIWFTTFAMGSPLQGRGWFDPRSERRFGMFLFPFWAVSSCCHCPSGYGHHMGQVCWSVPTCTRPTVVVGA